jgi:hypothetical protein
MRFECLSLEDIKQERFDSFGYLGGKNMLWTIIIILLVLWALGFGFAGASLGYLVHLLLLAAVVVLILQLVRGRAPRV